MHICTALEGASTTAKFRFRGGPCRHNESFCCTEKPSGCLARSAAIGLAIAQRKEKKKKFQTYILIPFLLAQCTWICILLELEGLQEYQQELFLLPYQLKWLRVSDNGDNDFFHNYEVLFACDFADTDIVRQGIQGLPLTKLNEHASMA